VIKLALLHPNQPIPIRSWTFRDESVIWVGRASDNHVILYSAVVSRRHVELRQKDDGWIVSSYGTNGTYWNDRPISKTIAEDGMVIRLAKSGPQLSIHFYTDPPTPIPSLPEDDPHWSDGDDMSEDKTLPSTTTILGEGNSEM
jgi:pSer/pThr/pTyr-binding forkhead associated (FHA) protein